MFLTSKSEEVIIKDSTNGITGYVKYEYEAFTPW